MADEFVQKVVEKAHIVVVRISNRVLFSEEKCTQVHAADALLSSTLGGITFPVCLGVLQKGLFRPLRITANLLLVGSVCGGISLVIASNCACLVFLSSVLLLKEIKDISVKNFVEKLRSFAPNKSVALAVSSKDIPICGAASLIVFKLLGGRFRSVLPSSLIHPGAFARKSIPAKGKNYASDGVKKKLGLLGRIYGCHSCGKRWRTSFVGDHIPPNKLVSEGQEQRFYPQCRSCSYQQGAALSISSRQLQIKTHGTSLRRYHLWLPLPIPLALLRTYVRDHLGVTVSGKQSDTKSQEPDKLLSMFVNGIRNIFKTRDKDDCQDNK